MLKIITLFSLLVIYLIITFNFPKCFHAHYFILCSNNRIEQKEYYLQKDKARGHQESPLSLHGYRSRLEHLLSLLKLFSLDFLLFIIFSISTKGTILHSFDKYLLSTYYLTGPDVGGRDTLVKTGNFSTFKKYTFQQGKKNQNRFKTRKGLDGTKCSAKDGVLTNDWAPLQSGWSVYRHSHCPQDL